MRSRMRSDALEADSFIIRSPRILSTSTEEPIGAPFTMVIPFVGLGLTMISIGIAGFISSELLRELGKRVTPWLRLR